jgi:hypothetical protein
MNSQTCKRQMQHGPGQQQKLNWPYGYADGQLEFHRDQTSRDIDLRPNTKWPHECWAAQANIMLSKERTDCVVLWAAHLMWTLGERPQKKEENRPEPSNETAVYMHVATQGWHQTLNWLSLNATRGSRNKNLTQLLQLNMTPNIQKCNWRFKYYERMQYC